MSDISDVSNQETERIEAAVYRRLVAHLRERTDVQNIDLMILAGFCRNCLSRWYQEAAQSQGQEMNKEESREIVYGMPFRTWKMRYQTDVDSSKQAEFERLHKKEH